MKHLLIIHDIGAKYQITGTRLENDDFAVDSDLYFEVKSVDFFEFVKELVMGNNTVTYPKTISPASEEDLLISPLKDLDIHKARARTKGKHILKGFTDFTILFDFFSFQVDNNWLISNGYFITDANREEKYLQVINTGDQVAIDTLERYLGSLDKLSVYKHTHDNFLEFKEAVNDATKIKEIDNLFDDFSSLFS